MNVVVREEKKFLVNVEEYRRKSHFLDTFLMQDSHNGSRGYMVRSLYFDTVYDGDLFDKLDGLETRRKIRLRIYDPRSDTALLEMKQKQGQAQRKRSLLLSSRDARQLALGNYEPLLSYREDFARECYGLMQEKCYRPCTVVEYLRRAYIARENRIRITFDSEISATQSCLDLFSDRLPLNPVLDPFSAVLEVKYNHFLLDYIRRLLNNLEKSELSVSKYVLARRQSYPDI